MNYSLLTFKKKLGFVSFLALASLIQITPSIAMDWNENGQNDTQGQFDNGNDIELTDSIWTAQRAGEEPRLPLNVYIKRETVHENHPPHSPTRTTGSSSSDDDSGEKRPAKRPRTEENSVQQPLPPMMPLVEAGPQQVQVQAPTAQKKGKGKQKTVNPPTTSAPSSSSNSGPSSGVHFAPLPSSSSFSSTLASGAGMNLPSYGGYNPTFMGNQVQASPYPSGAPLGMNSPFNGGYLPASTASTPPVIMGTNRILPAVSLVYPLQNSSMTQTMRVNPSPAPIPTGVQATTVSTPSTTMTTSTATATAPKTATPIELFDPVLEEINQLILKANNEDDEAQKALIDLYFEGRYGTYLTPERIGFCQWKSPQFPDLKNRCYNDDRFATYAIDNNLPLTSFPNLFDVVNTRAEGGNAIAQCNLGRMYGKGYGVKSDVQKAIEWYNQAALQDNCHAQCNLGFRYEFGHGVTKDLRVAADYYLGAAAQGYAIAQSNLANVYYNGYGVKKNYQKAVEWYIKAANQGNAVAQTGLAVLYYNGQGVDRDYQKAAVWYTKAANQGYARAQTDLAALYYNGQGVDRDYQKAAEWYTKAANQGNTVAQNYLGNMYYHGQGVDRDYQTAVEWHTKAARQGNTVAQNYLGNMYGLGYGVEKNLMTAFCYFMVGKGNGARDFLSSHLFYKPFSAESNTPWKDTLRQMAAGSAEKGLYFLGKRHLQKFTEEKNRQEFKLPNYRELYKQVHIIENNAAYVISGLFKKCKPGFMVPDLKFSDEMRHDYDKQANPKLVDRCKLLENGQTTIYTSFGEENIKLQNQLLGYLAVVDEKFKSADDALDKIAQVFYSKKKYEKAQAKLWEIRDNADPILNEKKNKLAEKIQKLQGPLEEIQDERNELARIKQQIKTLIRSTAKDRQDEFLKEYPFFSIKK